MNKKLLLLLSAYLLFPILGIFSCRELDCGGRYAKQYKVGGMNGRIYSASTASDTDLPSTSIIVNDTVLYNYFSIQLEMDITEYDYTTTQHIPAEFISSAYACSPNFPDPSTSEKIDSIKIFCDKEFSPTKPAGTDLSDLFDVVAYGKYGSDEAVTRKDLRQYLATKPTIAGSLLLLLKSPPAAAQKFTFTVKYYQDGVSNDYFEYTSPAVALLLQ